MDIAIKYKIILKIINSNDERRLNAIIEDEGDFWDELASDDQAAVKEGLKQLDNGQYISHQTVREEIKNQFNF